MKDCGINVLPIAAQYALNLIPFLRVAGVAHRLKVFDIILAPQAARKDMVNGHQFEIFGININMKTTCIICGFNQVGSFFITGGISAIQAVSAENP